MKKRHKFVLVSLILAAGLVVTEWVGVEYKYQALVLLGGVSYLLSAWALREGLRGIEWLMALVLPTLYPMSVGMFYFLLPQKWLSLVAVLVLFGIGMYALLLTANIFTVAAIRTIQLLRAAHAVGFLLTLTTAFFLFDTVLSFKLTGYWNAALVMMVSLPLMLQGLWSMELTEGGVTRRVGLYAPVVAVILAGITWGLSFWPVGVALVSLFLVAMLYAGLGLVQQYLAGRLFENMVKEYLFVGLVVVVTVAMLTRWTG